MENKGMMKTELGQKLLKQFENKLPIRKTKHKKFEILRSIKEELKEIRENGFSYKEISNELKKIEVEISVYHIKAFCIEELGEEKQKRRLKKSKKQNKNPIKKISKTEEKKPNQPAPGFRVAGDDL